MARKKVVFVIVEGPSDETALGVILSRYFDKDSVYTHVMHCDITTEFDQDTRQKVGSADITKKIAEVIKRWADTNRLKPEHFERIIHIVDTDGAFVAEDYVIQGDVEKPFYTLTKILCPVRKNIVERNDRKSKNLLRLASTPTIWKVPYNIYYMSCNLDHVLYDKQNSSDSDKENDALEFALHYRDNIPEFVNFITKSDSAYRPNTEHSLIENYKESWKEIQVGCNSLERRTNFGLVFG
ncbi:MULTISPECIES: hypothetical protein [unclassified Fibrobacter]|uniref:hypothetical protein n=1 Tax=unclassified Fibrobacter TaxID=2634177 RepID=UPI000D6B5320|nr:MULTISPECIES: hypothetical protein [unclassified Fibrobacter]PWJ54793.1 hypothetical protein BGX12_1712 [Fibrobacter sp. UWR4]PZW61596.1 hypothetical protein C8E88_10745 [Fibrobacter sp. UWR1]